VAPHVAPVSIRFRDIDALDHVNHAVILTYAETVRCDWFAANGWPSMANLPFIIASAHVEYKAPILKTDPIEIAMGTSRMGTKSWTFLYHVRNTRTGQVYATIETVQVGYDYKAQATVALDAALRGKLEALAPPA
jgi:acyl-CoA thioester hydrolase